MRNSGEQRVVLVVEDDVDNRHLICDMVDEFGYHPIGVGTAADAIRMSPSVHLFILDLTLPDMDGLQALRELRKSTSAPIIVCSARRSSTDCFLSLKAGADDFVGKPFDLNEFEARIEAVMRRSYSQTRMQPTENPRVRPEPFTAGPLMIDMASASVTINGKPLDLTTSEFRLMHCLVQHTNAVVGYDEIAQAVFGDKSDTNRRLVHRLCMHVSRLNAKLVRFLDAPVVECRRGSGYVLVSH